MQRTMRRGGPYRRSHGTCWWSVLGLLAIVAMGCTPRTDLMEYEAESGFDIAAPTSNQALVVFMRPGRMAGMVSSSIFDGKEFIGVLMDNTYIVAAETPGTHRFMVLGEAADFLGADLEAGKVYFAVVAIRMGVWRARFSLKPVTPNDEDWTKVREWITDAHRVMLNAAGKTWAQENAQSIAEKHDAYLEKWLSKPEGDRPMLYARDGIRIQDLP